LLKEQKNKCRERKKKVKEEGNPIRVGPEWTKKMGRLKLKTSKPHSVDEKSSYKCLNGDGRREIVGGAMAGVAN